MSAATRITDLGCATPRTAWTDADATIDHPPAAPPAGGWRLIDYRSDRFDGRLLQTSRPDSAELTLPLGLAGWHALSVGLAGHYDQSVVEVRLVPEQGTADGPWQILRAGPGTVQELPWVFADLTGLALQLRYPRDLRQLPGRLRGTPLSARVVSLHARPLDPAHLAELQADDDRRPLVYLNDGHSLFWWDAENADPAVVTRSVAAFADSDWGTCCFCNGGADLVNYPSAVGTVFGAGGWDDPRPENLRMARLLGELLDAGHDPLQLAIDQAHAQGHAFWYYVRPQAWVGEPPFDHAFRSRFFSANPQWRCLDADGRPLGKLSYAFPEVRAQVNAVIAEGLARGADGVGIALVRACPLLRYEQPVLARYHERHGGDARRVPDSDPRLQAVWLSFIEEWLGEIRALLAAHAGPDGPGPLVLISGPTPEWHAPFGIDIGALAAQGLVDWVLPYPDGDGAVDVAGFRDRLAGSGAALLPGLGSFTDHGISLAGLRRRAHDFYQAGADGLNRWDTPPWMARLQLDRPLVQRLWVQHYLAEQEASLVELAGLRLDEFPPLEGF